MSDSERLGIDPADLKPLDESKVRWDVDSQQWVMGDGESLHCHMYGPKVDKLPVGRTFIWDKDINLSKVETATKYAPELDNAYFATLLLSTLYYIGFSDEEIKTLTIDDAVNRVRDIYNYPSSRIDSAGKIYLKRKNIGIMRQLRRSYQKIQITDGLINGN